MKQHDNRGRTITHARQPTQSRNRSHAAITAPSVHPGLALDRLGDWSANYGRVWVFLGFFLAMSLGGRWFWGGADQAITWAKTRITG